MSSFFGNEGCFEQTSAHETLEVSKVKTGLPSEEESSNPRPSPHPPLPGCHLDQPNLPQLQREQFFIQNNEDKEYKIETDDTSYGHITTQQSQPLVKVTKDICQNFYATGVLSSQNLRKKRVNQDNSKFKP